MILNIGQNFIVYHKDIVGIFDFDRATVKRQTVKFLKNAEKQGNVVEVGNDIPKSFVLTSKNNKNTVYFTTLSSSALLGRVEKGELGADEIKINKNGNDK